MEGQFEVNCVSTLICCRLTQLNLHLIRRRSIFNIKGKGKYYLVYNSSDFKLVDQLREKRSNELKKYYCHAQPWSGMYRSICACQFLRFVVINDGILKRVSMHSRRMRHLCLQMYDHMLPLSASSFLVF